MCLPGKERAGTKHELCDDGPRALAEELATLNNLSTIQSVEFRFFGESFEISASARDLRSRMDPENVADRRCAPGFSESYPLAISVGPPVSHSMEVRPVRFTGFVSGHRSVGRATPWHPSDRRCRGPR